MLSQGENNEETVSRKYKMLLLVVVGGGGGGVGCCCRDINIISENGVKGERMVKAMGGRRL